VNRTIRRAITALAVIAASIMALAGPVSAANAAPAAAAAPARAATTAYLIEKYQCNLADPNAPGGSPDAWRICDGTWYHAQPNYGNSWRSIRIVAEISYNPSNSNSFQTTGITYAQNRFPDQEKVIHWYCRYSGGGTSAQLTTTTLGGSLPGVHSWNPKYQPCNGYGEGMVAEVHGSVGPTDTHDYVTKIDLNTSQAGSGYQFGNQAFEGQ
jgi:hypothetical protein